MAEPLGDPHLLSTLPAGSPTPDKPLNEILHSVAPLCLLLVTSLQHPKGAKPTSPQQGLPASNHPTEQDIEAHGGK
jgi:hypothetical protein